MAAISLRTMWNGFCVKEFNSWKWCNVHKQVKMTSADVRRWLKCHQEDVIQFLAPAGNRIPTNYISKTNSLNEAFSEELNGGRIRDMDVHAVVQRECPIVMHVRFDQYSKKELIEWCDDNTKDRCVVKENSFVYNKGYCHKVFFKNEKDALLFKLTYETL